MTTAIDDGRQYRLVAIQPYSAVAADGDFVDGAVSAVSIKLPAGSVILGGGVRRTVASNASGTAVLDVGITGSANALVNDVDLKTTGFTAFTGLGVVNMAGADVILTPAANTGATAGAGYVVVEYVILGRSQEVQPA